MTKQVWSAVFCVAFLAIAEVVLRIPVEAPLPEPAVFHERPDVPVFFALGTSRTKRAVDPGRIEPVLEELGIVDPHVNNVSFVGMTNVYLYRLYMEEIQPIVRRNPMQAVLAIEARASGFNDSYMSSFEQRWATTNKQPALGPPPFPEPAEEDSSQSTPVSTRPKDFIDYLAEARFDEAAKSVLWRMKIVQGRDETRRWWSHVQARFETDERLPVIDEAEHELRSVDSRNLAPVTTRIPTWTKGRRGFVPEELNKVGGSWQIDKWRQRYEGSILKDFEMGGIQTDYLRRLIRQAKNDGLVPILYVMPITDIHKSFYAPGLHAEAMAFMNKVAREEDVRLVDLDTNHGYPDRAFQDTHHLDRSILDVFNRTFAEDVLFRAYQGR